jgi:hypothetical protein
MGSWLTDLEKRKKEEVGKKHRQEHTENLHREQEKLRWLRLIEQYERQYKKQIDSICTTINQLLSRATAAGVLDLSGGGLHITKDACGSGSLHFATIDRTHRASRIEIFLEDGGQIKVSYRWQVEGGYKKSREQMLPIRDVTASVIEDWIEWVVSKKTEDWFGRKWRRFRRGY